ncbi:MAG TPA: nucleotidyltransferase domain-containing protein [Candidatus Angelobacter sp.]|nr:nucleotidyltransferase domain-containing protein [Candidatus Angelobacter sp.]
MTYAAGSGSRRPAIARPNCGTFGNEEAALAVVVTRLVETLDPEAIYLFGSRASGIARPDSDFDLLVVTRTEDGDAAFDYDRVYSPLLGLGVGCDVVPCPKHEFDAEKERPTSLCYVVHQRGRKLYERR